MVKNDLTQKYDKPTILIHWLTALLILVLFPLGKYVEELEQIEKLEFLKIHVIVGIIVFVLSIYRSYLYFKSPRPPHLKTGSEFNDKLIIWVHNIFYILLFLIPVTGIVALITTGYGEAVFARDISLVKPHKGSIPLETHEILSTIMMIVFALHVIGVIKHKILTKENTIKRIS